MKTAEFFTLADKTIGFYDDEFVKMMGKSSKVK